ncbi:Hypp3229 [Branchiostoma lanceolatum]|uniref:Hypp3229 protein n=1 Tax=Branchiostoma lanceolatum TaxID=7740 RepID=A0A8K0A0W2_BRALA|nr:Hypp3229 [Branchiostoma lanceolatum]
MSPVGRPDTEVATGDSFVHPVPLLHSLKAAGQRTLGIRVELPWGQQRMMKGWGQQVQKYHLTERVVQQLMEHLGDPPVHKTSFCQVSPPTLLQLYFCQQENVAS